MDFIANTPEDQKAMMQAIGIRRLSDLFEAVPKSLRLSKISLPKGLSEMEVLTEMSRLSRKNCSLREVNAFLGGGIYDHFIPSIVKAVISRGEFSTAYTPYQPEASQGTLQAIYEYQSMICELTGMDVANASLYDGATAVAEAAILALRATEKKTLYVSRGLNPQYRAVLKTYFSETQAQIKELPLSNGITLCPGEIPEAAAVLVQSPNFLGAIESLAPFSEICRRTGALLISVANPIALALLAPPGEEGADIVVGEGQPLGNPSYAGGATFGFLASKEKWMWKIPGRVVGGTCDRAGQKGFVLTLQTREQHIRREKAVSNICTNQSLNALAACVFLAALGKKGLVEVAELNIQKSHYAARQISRKTKFRLAHRAPFFNEFVLKSPKPVREIQKRLLRKNILPGIDISKDYPELGEAMLLCVTETKTRAQIDGLVRELSQF